LHAQKHGSFGYVDNTNLPKLSSDEFEKFITTIKKEYDRDKETFVKHFKKNYGDKHDDLPIWMAGELMSFGTLYTFFKGISEQDEKIIATQFGVDDIVLKSWFGCLNTIRNICAHHSRLWNREFGVKPMIPNKNLLWHNPIQTPNNRIFGVLTIFLYLIKTIAPQSNWKKRFMDLLKEYPNIPLASMGFPKDWKNHALWMSVEEISKSSKNNTGDQKKLD
jgi:abortive infection bacteriophage resistance protein